MPHKVPLECLGIDILEANTPWLHTSAYFKNANPQSILPYTKNHILFIHSYLQLRNLWFGTFYDVIYNIIQNAHPIIMAKSHHIVPNLYQNYVI
jgi:hypothetical protein